jgi:hypothetical protein
VRKRETEMVRETEIFEDRDIEINNAPWVIRRRGPISD